MPSMPLPSHTSIAAPQPVPLRPSRPTLTNGGASSSSSLNSPPAQKISQDISGEGRVLGKRKLHEMVATVLGDEDPESLVDGDVEELLLDLADEFVQSVTTFACRLAKHRKSDSLEARDIHMHLERNWNMRLPGFASDEIRPLRRMQPTQSYQQKVQSVGVAKQVGRP